MGTNTKEPEPPMKEHKHTWRELGRKYDFSIFFPTEAKVTFICDDCLETKRITL